MNGETSTAQLLRSIQDIHFVRIVVTLALAWLLTALIERGTPQLANRLPGRMRMFILPYIPVTRLAIQIIAIGVVLTQIVNPSFESLVTILGAAGLAIGFGFKDYVSSIIAGVVTIYERPYRPGDWVEIGGVYGEVRSIGLRALKLVTPDDTVVTIPHQLIWNESIHNANDGLRDLMCVADFYLHPENDAAQIQQTLKEVALTSPYIQLDRPVSVVVHEKLWATHFRLKAYPIDSRDQFLFISDMTVRGKQALARLGAHPASIPPAIQEQASPRQ